MSELSPSNTAVIDTDPALDPNAAPVNGMGAPEAPAADTGTPPEAPAAATEPTASETAAPRAAEANRPATPFRPAVLPHARELWTPEKNNRPVRTVVAPVLGKMVTKLLFDDGPLYVGHRIISDKRFKNRPPVPGAAPALTKDEKIAKKAAEATAHAERLNQKFAALDAQEAAMLEARTKEQKERAERQVADRAQQAADREQRTEREARQEQRTQEQADQKREEARRRAEQEAEILMLKKQEFKDTAERTKAETERANAEAELAKANARHQNAQAALVELQAAELLRTTGANPNVVVAPVAEANNDPSATDTELDPDARKTAWEDVVSYLATPGSGPNANSVKYGHMSESSIANRLVKNSNLDETAARKLAGEFHKQLVDDGTLVAETTVDGEGKVNGYRYRQALSRDALLNKYGVQPPAQQPNRKKRK